jgi:hypothetical protein
LDGILGGVSDSVVGIVLHLAALAITAVIFWGAMVEEKRSVADYHRLRDAGKRRSA